MHEINPVPVMCKNCKMIYSLGAYHQCPSCECLGYVTVSLETPREEPKPEHVWMEEEQRRQEDHDDYDMNAIQQSVWDKQEGGSHYKNMAIQPAKYIQDNGMDWLSGNIVKYASRHKAKGGRQDVEKIIHYAQMLLEEYDEDCKL